MKVPTEEALLQDTSPDVRPTDTAPSDLTPAATGLSAQRDDEASFDVREVQQALVASHGAQLVVDGIIGARTRAAIAAWQATIGAEETGYLSAAQLSLLLGQEP